MELALKKKWNNSYTKDKVNSDFFFQLFEMIIWVVTVILAETGNICSILFRHTE